MVARNNSSTLFTTVVSPRQQIAKNTPLPEDFQPTEWSVICGRGRECFNHVGNRRFRSMLESYRRAYIDAPTRTDKSMVVIEIVNNFRRAMPLGAFVKKNPKTKKWFDVGDQQAREKVGHAIREATAGQKAKKAAALKASRRDEANQESSSSEVPKPAVFSKSISLPINGASSCSSEDLSCIMPEPMFPTKRSQDAVSLVDVLADISSALDIAKSPDEEEEEVPCFSKYGDCEPKPVNPEGVIVGDVARHSMRLSIDSAMGSQLLRALDLDEADRFLVDDFGDMNPIMHL